jgi:hypothetical protein
MLSQEASIPTSTSISESKYLKVLDLRNRELPIKIEGRS